jgi:phenylalanyl-tRNA synthetase beta chain
MKVALSWLKKWVNLNHSADQIATYLTSLGIEVEYIESFSSSIENVVVAEIKSVLAHPNAEKLQIAQVFDGSHEWQIVCGAANCRSGLKVVLARIGAQLPGGFEIKKAKLRGIESFGMLCSLDEIGYQHCSDGIHELSDDALLGSSPFEYINDPVFVLSLTPNLGHCLSIEGIALELAAKLDQPLLNTQSINYPLIPTLKNSTAIKIETPLATQFACIKIENVVVAPSPNWLKENLKKAGYLSINNIVDTANWLMLEHGRPVHVYDAKSLKGDIRIALSKGDEFIARIDGTQQILKPSVVTVFSGQEAIAIAGVMGSSKHQVNEQTSEILFEIAVYDSQAIRKNTKLSQCQSESSRRFERGIDIQKTEQVINNYINLLTQLGLNISYSNIECINSPLGENIAQKHKIKLRSKDVERILNFRWSLSEIATWLQRLKIESVIHENSDSESYLECHIPSWRHDLNIAEDLIEEIMRLIGTENIPKSPLAFALTSDHHDPIHIITKQLRHDFASFGLQEVVSADLISASKVLTTQRQPLSLLKVINPSSNEMDVLRPNLLANFLEISCHNFDQQNLNLAFFEVGHVYQADEIPKNRERLVASILLTGNKDQNLWLEETKSWDFYDIKGIVESLMSSCNLSYNLEKSVHPDLHPFQQAQWIDHKGQILAVGGHIHPQLLAHYEINVPIFYAEFSVSHFIDSKNLQPLYQSLTSYPDSTRDWTLNVEELLTYELLLKIIPRVEFLSKIELIGIWRHLEKLGEGMKNMTLRFHYQSLNKTLTQQEVERAHNYIKEHVIQHLQLET